MWCAICHEENPVESIKICKRCVEMLLDWYETNYKYVT